ncbi:MAG TPA: transcriptional regulator [Candidatus Coprenecus stercoripullorum]|nr:transcriptional regulator [Candidatus Coprenecus stercoripullorum]
MTAILIFIKHHIPFIWNIVEYINSQLFYILYRKQLEFLGEKYSQSKDSVRILRIEDMVALSEFFNKQPADSFEYFKPHAFDYNSLVKKNKDKSFIMIGVFSNNEIIGYGFLRCFFNGKAFRGKIVDISHQGHGIAKQIGSVLTDMATLMHLRLFATISKDNVKSISSSSAVNKIKILKELPDNYIYVEYLRKQ